ncbi:MAG: hypothetical protein RR397_08395 [Odoribacter sp.]
MIICTADLDWISIVILAIAGLGSLIKAFEKKKQQQKPEFQQPEERDEEMLDEIEEEYTNYKSKVKEASYSVETIPSTDYYKKTMTPSLKEEKENLTLLSVEEEEKEENPHFDIRQAIISSEILNRPQY